MATKFIIRRYSLIKFWVPRITARPEIQLFFFINLFVHTYTCQLYYILAATPGNTENNSIYSGFSSRNNFLVKAGFLSHLRQCETWRDKGRKTAYVQSEKRGGVFGETLPRFNLEPKRDCSRDKIKQNNSFAKLNFVCLPRRIMIIGSGRNEVFKLA